MNLFGIEDIWTIEATLNFAAVNARPDALAIRDLWAQEGMHRAADGMLFVTLIGVVLAFFQLLIAGLTAWGLVQNLKMTSRALEHSDANIDLGRAALEETRAFTKMQLRAYLGLGPITGKIIQEDGTFVLELVQQFKNYGAAATAELYPCGEMFLMKKPPAEAEAAQPKPLWKAWRQIMPGHELNYTTRLGGLDKHAVEMIERGEWCVVHAFRIRYVNPSGHVAGDQLGRDTVHWGADLCQARPLKGPEEDDQTISGRATQGLIS